MKRFVTLLLTFLLLAVALCVSASASDFDAVAEDLSGIGMFRGTASGFELDRAPTRSEAAIMLVRLYGAEDAAKAAYEAGEINHPFTDVSAFTSPYVAWLYTNGITNGFTETTYASQRPCTAQNYVVFLLRALGYQDGTDFQYANALTFAQEKGFYDPILFSGDFLRDDLAALTYQGLAADMAGRKTYLLDSLIKSGAVDAAAAKPLTEKIEAYRAMSSATAKLDDTAMDLDMKMKMDVTIQANGETVTTTADVTGNMKMLLNGTDIQLAYLLKVTADGESAENAMWMKDGWLYLYGADGTLLKYPVEDPSATMKDMGVIDMDSMDVSALAMLDSIAVKKSGSNTIYTVVINENMGGILERLDMTEEDALGMTFSPITTSYTLDRNGNLKSIAMVFDAAMSMDMPTEDGSSLPAQLNYSYDITMTVNATGSKVKITWPDLSSASEIVGGTSWPAA